MSVQAMPVSHAAPAGSNRDAARGHVAAIPVRTAALTVLPIWAAGAAVVLAAVAVARRIFPPVHLDKGPLHITHTGPGVRVWDVAHYLWIAEHGYGKAHPYEAAFAPGLPALVRVTSLPLLGHTTVAGVLVALASAYAAMVVMWLLAQECAPGVAPGAVVAAWAFNPLSVFLFVPYSEALFTAVGGGALLAAVRRSWWAAGVLAAAAVLVRPTGVCLAFAVGVAWIAAEPLGRVPRAWRAAPALLLPVLPYLAWNVWLSYRFGGTAVQADALRSGWGRYVTDPVSGFLGTCRRIAWCFHSGGTPVGVELALEVVALVGLALLTVHLLRRRVPAIWVAYTGALVLMLSVSSYWSSCLRALLVVPPLWWLVAGALERSTNGPGRLRLAVAGLVVLFTFGLVFAEGVIFLG